VAPSLQEDWIQGLVFILEGGGWHLDGQKHWIGNSTIAGARRFRARIRGRSKNPRREEPIIFRGGRG